MALPKQPQIHDVLISVLAELNGEARPQQVYPRVTAHFPQIAPGDLTETLKDGRKNRWTNRIQWARQDLVEAGYIDASKRGIWRLTEPGWARARGEVGPGARESATAEEDTEASAPEPAGDGNRVVRIPSQVTVVVDALERTQHLSARPADYEVAIAEALDFLGFDVQLIGGSGDTDLVAEAPLGVGRYAMVVDAKTTARGRVADAQINWPAIDDHRKRRGADFAVVVGPEFAGGNLLSRAEQFQVTLLTTQQLAALVEIHARIPFTLDELRTAFERGAKLDSAALNELRAVAGQTERSWVLLSSLIEQIDAWSRLKPDLVLAQPMTIFSSLLNTNDERMQGLTLEEVEDGLAVLSSMAVGILRRVRNGGEGFVLTTTPAGAHQRLLALARAVSTSTESTTKRQGTPQSAVDSGGSV